MADWRRSLRLLFKLGLFISLPLAGYFWATLGAIPLTLVTTAVCIVMAIGAESLASSAESRLSKLMDADVAAEEAFKAEAAIRDERLRQLDRMVENLSSQNHDLRGKLVSVHGEMHRFDEEAYARDQQAQPAKAADGDATAPPAQEGSASEVEEPAAEESSGGEVTDLSSHRNRR